MHEDSNLESSEIPDRPSQKPSHLNSLSTSSLAKFIASAAANKANCKYSYKNVNPTMFLSPQHSYNPSLAFPKESKEAKISRLFSPKTQADSIAERNSLKALSQSMAKLPGLSLNRNEKLVPQELMKTVDYTAEPTIPRIDPSKISIKKTGIIKAYAANTHQGIIRYEGSGLTKRRNYNEDRVAIILNMVKPTNKKVAAWPKCALFGIYDGHGGPTCAEFLRDNLHHIVLQKSL